MINPFYLSDSFILPFSASFRSRQTETFPETGASVDSSVFPVAVWPDFLESAECTALKAELAGMTFQHRSTDFFEFHQTNDLKHVCPSIHPSISQLCSELYSPQFLGIMERVTGRRLGSHVDISGQRYQHGDFLLCHDDRIDKRRIALILYLVEKDSVMQGGRLFAMRSDEEGRPVMDTPTTVTPKWNTLAFFEVSRFSFHQVEQIYSESIPRYSITCWFHDLDEAEESVAPTISFDLIQPIKFTCHFPVETLLNDVKSLSKSLYRPYFRGKFLSSAQFAHKCPDWMSSLLHDSFHRKLESITGWNLDWPTKPVVWCLTSPSHFLLFDNQIDRQQDVEYNYKERSVTQAPSGIKLHLSLVIRFSQNSGMLKPFIKLHLEPMRIKKLPTKYSKLIIVSMKFNKSTNNDRSLLNV